MKNKSVMNIINKIGPKIDPCDRPNKITNFLAYLSILFSTLQLGRIKS